MIMAVAPMREFEITLSRKVIALLFRITLKIDRFAQGEMGISAMERLGKITQAHLRYFRYHRAHVLKKRETSTRSSSAMESARVN